MAIDERLHNSNMILCSNGTSLSSVCVWAQAWFCFPCDNLGVHPFKAKAVTMKCVASVSVCLVAAAAASKSGSPIGKVLEMISDLEKKTIGEGDASQKAYEEVAEFCSDRQKEVSVFCRHLYPYRCGNVRSICTHIYVNIYMEGSHPQTYM